MSINLYILVLIILAWVSTVRIGSINSPVYVPSNPYFLQPNKIMPSDGYSHSGYGIHIWNITVSRLGSYERTILAASVIYVPALALAKLALLMLYYTLLRTVTH
ncbi:hypothetical protein AOCH_004293, partial [Aspergillus ochraceoroseus]